MKRGKRLLISVVLVSVLGIQACSTLKKDESKDITTSSDVESSTNIEKMSISEIYNEKEKIYNELLPKYKDYVKSNSMIYDDFMSEKFSENYYTITKNTSEVSTFLQFSEESGFKCGYMLVIGCYFKDKPNSIVKNPDMLDSIESIFKLAGLDNFNVEEVNTFVDNYFNNSGNDSYTTNIKGTPHSYNIECNSSGVMLKIYPYYDKQ